MALPRHARLIYPYLAQFRPATRELWLDYRITLDHSYRLGLELSEDGEKFKFLSVAARPLDLQARGPDIPHPAVDPVCSRIEFF